MRGRGLSGVPCSLLRGILPVRSSFVLHLRFRYVILLKSLIFKILYIQNIGETKKLKEQAGKFVSAWFSQT